MKKVVYLFGAGAIQGEMDHYGWKGRVLMDDINERISQMSSSRGGPYSRLLQQLAVPPSKLDVEQMLSLFEDVYGEQSPLFTRLRREVRRLFHSVVYNALVQRRKYLPSELSSALLQLHYKYGQLLGDNGEKLLGTMTVNFDTVVDRASDEVYGGVNYGIPMNYSSPKQKRCPPTLKLHGSFSWRRRGSKLHASLNYESRASSEQSLWLRPSVFKKPDQEYRNLWLRASEILMEAETLRVVGCSLRSEDWALVALIFKSQVLSKSKYDIELIVPRLDPEDTKAVRNRLRFLGKVRLVQETYTTDFDERNPVKSYVIKRINEAALQNEDVKEDPIIKRIL